MSFHLHVTGFILHLVLFLIIFVECILSHRVASHDCTIFYCAGGPQTYPSPRQGAFGNVRFGAVTSPLALGPWGAGQPLTVSSRSWPGLDSGRRVDWNHSKWLTEEKEAGAAGIGKDSSQGSPSWGYRSRSLWTGPGGAAQMVRASL